MRKLRICIFTLNPLLGGGVPQLTVGLGTYLLDEGHQVHIYFPKKYKSGLLPGYLAEFFGRKDLKSIAIPKIPKIQALSRMDILGRIPRQYDIYQAIDGTCAQGYAFHVKRVPYFCWAATTYSRQHGWRRSGPIDGLQIALCRKLERKAAWGAERVFALSSDTEEALRREFGLPRDRIAVVHAPVDTEYFKPATQDHASEPRENPYILFVGRVFDPRKNVSLLLESFARVSKRRQDVRLVIAGSGRQNPVFVDQCKKLDINKSVHFLGEIKDIVALYGQASLMALSSHQEGLAIVLLESLACGTPVVSTDCGGPRDIVKDGVNGFLVPNNDPDTMASRMLRILDDEALRKRMGQAARASAAEHFSAQKTCGAILEEYYRHLS